MANDMMRLLGKVLQAQRDVPQAQKVPLESGGPSGGSCAKPRNVKTECTERKNFENHAPNRVFEGDERRESAGDSRALFSAFGLSFKALPAKFWRVRAFERVT
jgi:hypothetical protein